MRENSLPSHCRSDVAELSYLSPEKECVPSSLFLGMPRVAAQEPSEKVHETAQRLIMKLPSNLRLLATTTTVLISHVHQTHVSRWQLSWDASPSFTCKGAVAAVARYIIIPSAPITNNGRRSAMV